MNVERIAAALTDSVLAVDAQEKINAAVDHGSGVIMFNWSAGTCDSIAEAVSSRFRIVGNLLEFLAGSLFVELHSLTEQVGSKLWPELQLDLSAKVGDALYHLLSDSFAGFSCRRKSW